MSALSVPEGRSSQCDLMKRIRLGHENMTEHSFASLLGAGSLKSLQLAPLGHGGGTADLLAKQSAE
ncbi:hypothetical protein EYF80_008066 [Liparis tanakae]|uniref:Uncharacterized protein n=1 Tax=Liparis tanakae TaxID=230148 RepID=A0A4Z2IUF4_9TELE|nr:hypothetical protein EYF80_008066 [Liparis tanakae]